MPVTFSDGLFRFKISQDTYVLHYWTPVKLLAQAVTPPATTRQPDSEVQHPDQNATSASSAPAVELIDVTNQQVDLEKVPVTLGHALSDSSCVRIKGEDSEWISLRLEGMVDPLKKWERLHHRPPSYETLALEQERATLLSSYEPMSAQFTEILSKAESAAHARFKWGGLFFLSAQLGFVSRCTWFEYSWDIMEPITWCITYSLMISTFAYYVMTSQEFMLPLAEKRAVQERFWKLVKKHNFNVQEFKRLRKQLLALEQRASGGQQTAFDRVMRSLQS